MRQSEIHKKPVTHTPQNILWVLLSRSPLLSQFFRLCGLARSASGTTLCLRNLCATHCSACLHFVCLCKHVRSHLPSTVLLSSSFDKLTCKEGLFTLGPREGHVPPPGMQAWASLSVCQIVFTLRAWSFAMC